jgi:hypothetical protein
MELLLILSAMLSAVTGAFSGVRGPEARVPHAEAAVGAQLATSIAEEQAPRPAPSRPADEPQATRIEALPTFAVAAAAPLYADRLIE